MSRKPAGRLDRRHQKRRSASRQGGSGPPAGKNAPAGSQARREYLARRRAALAGWDTRRANIRRVARTRAARVKATKHGQAARERSERKLTPAQRQARRRDVRRIERQERATRKKSQRAIAPRPRSSRLPTLPRIKARGKPSASKRRRGRSTRRRTTPATKRTTKARTSTTTTRTIEIADAGGGDALRVQLRVDLELPAGLAADERNAAVIRRLADDAVLHQIEHGRPARFTYPKVLRWQNPGRKRGELRQWRQGNQPDAWTTLGPAIKAAIEASR